MKRTQDEITLLHEYRARLIADVVTGKLDVRYMAAELPEIDALAMDDTLDGMTTGDGPGSGTGFAATGHNELENPAGDEGGLVGGEARA